MKKKFWSNFFMGILAMGLIAGCSSDEWEEGGNTPNPDLEDAVYMNVQVQLPVAGAGTRSNTKPEGGSSDGTEVGKPDENKVKRVLLVMANKDNNKIVCYGANNIEDGKSESSIIGSIHKINKTVLAKYYEDNGTNGTLSERTVKVYVFCNPTTTLEKIVADDVDGTWINATAEIHETYNEQNQSGITGADGAAIWGGSDHKNGFLMSNAGATEKDIPGNIKDWDVYQSADKAFNLSGPNNANTENEINNSGSIKVERSVARFDFRDGSPVGNFTYTLIEETEDAGGKKPIIQIQLKRMGLVNMSKHFYYLRRVSNNGKNDGSFVGGLETNENYVVDTDADEKSAANLDNFQFGDYFNFCLGSGVGKDWTINADARNGWYNSLMSDVVKGDEDDWENPEKNKYHIWRYVTENTIPAAGDGQIYQKNGVSTGIVFKGKIVVPENTTSEKHQTLIDAIKNATGDSDKDPILYAYGSNLFVSWTEVRAYAIANKEADKVFYETVFGTNFTKTPVAAQEAKGDTPAVEAVYSDDTNSPDYAWNAWHNTEETNPETVKSLLLAFKKKATGALFTLYQSSIDGEDAGYYCYYYYWNRHNDNQDLSVMGPMEFAVVRNNVYKLAVTGIKQLGHPRIPENDPDPKDPDDPDESSDIYITLSVEVLPWAVRVNNIEF